MSRHDLSDDNDGLVPGFPPGGGWSGPAGPVALPGSGLDPRAVPRADVPAVPGVPAPAAKARHAQRPQRPRRPRRLAGGLALTLLVAAGLAGVGGGGVGLALELTRTATKAEVAAAVQAEMASRWQRLAAGKIFPEAVGYSTSDESAPMTARLVGIASPASCAAALDPPAASLLRRYGCVTVLRAIYVDGSGTLATTAGIVVMTSASAASQAVSASGGAPASTGVRTFRLPGTVADQFGDPQRRAFSPLQSTGPYVSLYAAGYTDGRVSGSGITAPPLVDLASGVMWSLQRLLTTHGSACQMKDIRC